MNNAENSPDELTPVGDVVEPPVRRSPGAMLMVQRETLELSVQRVADQMHLTMHFVRALESDSYEKLPADVFVRGYIRTYARLLGLDSDQVLMIYDEFNSHKIARKEEAIKRHARRRKDKNRPWVLVSGVAFVTVAVALWYLKPGEPSDATTDAVAATAPVLNNVIAGIPPGQIPATASESAIATSAQESSAERGMATSNPSSVGDAATQIGTQDGTQITAQTQTYDMAPQATEHSASAMAPAASGRTVMEYWAGDDELRLGFGADSSVQIEHKGGSETHDNSHVAGDTLVIRGTAPFSVLLGDARDVSLSFNGRQIDIGSNIRADNSARLSIGM